MNVKSPADVSQAVGGQVCEHPPTSMIYPAFNGRPFCIECSTDRVCFAKYTREGAISYWRALDEAEIDAQLIRGRNANWEVWHSTADHARALEVIDQLRGPLGGGE